jgi:hypothetical protein
MPFDYQVVVDSRDPHAQADWWAEAMGWDVEPSDEAFIRSMVDQGYATDEDTLRHRGTLVWRTGAAIVHPEGRGRGPGARILFQLVPEEKAVKNRVHLDLAVGQEHVEEEVARLVERGARELHRGSEGPHGWVTMADPEGNEFCVH